MEMLVTEALNELKLLDKRITNEIGKAKFVIEAKKSEANAMAGVTKEQFAINAKASIDSITAMIDRYTKIKSAIIESNAKTIVTVANKQMTVADAIAMKDIVLYKKSLTAKMGQQYSNAQSVVAQENSVVDEKVDQLVEASYGSEKKQSISAKDYAAIANPYREANEYCLVDPLDAATFVKKENDFIDEFISTVDSKLQIANCKTVIEI